MMIIKIIIVLLYTSEMVIKKRKIRHVFLETIFNQLSVENENAET